MLNARQFQQYQNERHLRSGRFKTYMAMWSVFFAVVVGITVFDNARKGFDTGRQSAGLTTTQQR